MTMTWLSDLPTAVQFSSTARPIFLRYQFIEFSISDTNTTTLGVVGAAVMHGPNSALTLWVDRHPSMANAAPQIGLDARLLSMLGVPFHIDRCNSVD
jgi:hypothetical protein